MIVAKSNINLFARIDALEYDEFEPAWVEVPPIRYGLVWAQELYEDYFWSNLRDIRGEDVVWESNQ